MPQSRTRLPAGPFRFDGFLKRVSAAPRFDAFACRLGQRHLRRRGGGLPPVEVALNWRHQHHTQPLHSSPWSLKRSHSLSVGGRESKCWHVSVRSLGVGLMQGDQCCRGVHHIHRRGVLVALDRESQAHAAVLEVVICRKLHWIGLR